MQLFNCIQRIGNIRDQIFFILKTKADTDQLCRYASFNELLVCHLSVGGGGRVQAAGSCICYVSLNCAKL